MTSPPFPSLLPVETIAWGTQSVYVDDLHCPSGQGDDGVTQVADSCSIVLQVQSCGKERHFPNFTKSRLLIGLLSY